MPPTIDMLAAIRRHPLVASAIWGQPWAISRQGYDLLQARFLTGSLPESDEPETTERVARIGGVGVRLISGVLLDEPDEDDWYWWGPPPDDYKAIWSDIDALANDPDITAVMLYIKNCPGGMVRGLWSLCDQLRAVRESKPVIAVIEGYAYSAACAIATQASLIVIGPEDDTGSIGVIMEHMSLAGMLDKEGVAITPIFAGAHKTDGHIALPLSDQAHAQYQLIVDRAKAEFNRVVTAGRPPFPANAAEAEVFEALTFEGARAIQVGLADEIGTLESTLEALLSGPQQEV